ncbi:MAG: LPS export ABC transporter periplasmic protein LptC [Micavibrio sp.]
MTEIDGPSANPAATDERDNLTRLLNLGRRKRPRINRRYSFFVRGMRLLLPLAALAIVTIVMAWPRMDDNISSIPKEDLIPQTTGRNELIDPHFESTTSNQQPYVITASRAVQSLKDQSLVLLENPVADVTIKPGEILNAKSERGAYRQDTEILVMDGKVNLRHNSGYLMTSERLNISMKDQLAWSELPVNGEGPAGTIAAQGMQADNVKQTLVFTGPAKLILNQSGKGTP